MSRKGKMNLTFVLGSAAPILLLFSGVVSSDGGLYSAQLATSSPRDAIDQLVHERSATPSYGAHVSAMLHDGLPVLTDTNRCKKNVSYVWCLPADYNQEKHPFSYFHMVNKTLPWE